jgi:hypothetical protein
MKARITAAKAAHKGKKQPRFSTSVRQGSQKLSPNSEIEKLAEEVAAEFGTVCAKLSELRPKVEKIQLYFRESVRGSVTLAGCRSFREFCEKRLRRCEQTVYKMLASDPEKREPGKTIPKAPPTRPKPVVASEDFERLRCACTAASRHFDAEDTGDKAEAENAKAEFRSITNAPSIKPLITGDVPNYCSILLDLLTTICKLDARLPLPTLLTRSVAAVRKRLGLNAENFGILSEQDPPPSADGEHSRRPIAETPRASQSGEAMPNQTVKSLGPLVKKASSST